MRFAFPTVHPLAAPLLSRQRLARLSLCFAGLTLGFVRPASATVTLDPLPENSTTLFGSTLEVMGDVNGDGVPDLAVGAPYQDGDFDSIPASYKKPQNVGKIFILSGTDYSMLSLCNDPEFELVQPQHFGGQLGASLGVVGDLNGDGVADLIAGVPHHIDNPSTREAIINAGEALVFSGKDGTLLFTLRDPTTEEDGKMGTAVAGLGDVNADGIPDLLVGVPGKDIGGEDGIPNVGLAYIFSGANGSLIRTLNHPAQDGAEAGAALGSAVANAGDVDGDGVSDAIVGAPGEGHVFVFSGKTGAVLFDIASPAPETLHSFGAAVAGGKDFNKDKKPDFVIGAPLQKNLAGAAYIYSGSSGTLLRELKPQPSQRYAKFGAAVAATDDLTGDRRPDVLVGAPGADANGVMQAGMAFIFDGTRGRLSRTLTSVTPQDSASFGAAVTAADFNADNLSTPIIGVPHEDTTISGVAHLQIGQVEVQQ